MSPETIELYSMPLFAVLLAGELTLRSLGFGPAYSTRDSLCSAAMGLFYAATSALVRAPALVMLFATARWAPWSITAGDGPLTWLAAYVAVDLAFYWYHRILHEVRLGWAAHVNHHSSRHFNYTTSLRQSFVEPMLEPLMLVPLAIIGFDPVLLVACLVLNFVYQFWPHTELGPRLDGFGRVFVTPSHHRVHHAFNVRYLDKNYGGTLILWDKLFGTFEAEGEAPDFGITHNIDTYNPIKATLHEWRAIASDLRNAASLRSALGYLFQPPGWSPDGNGQTSRERQRRAGL